jgi:uncharacterized membrane protein YgcG
MASSLAGRLSDSSKSRPREVAIPQPRRVWMKTTRTVIVMALLLAAMTVPVFAEPRCGDRSGGYSVSNPNHRESLGGRSRHADRGLERASSHSPRVESSKPGSGGGTVSGGGSIGSSK